MYRLYAFDWHIFWQYRFNSHKQSAPSHTHTLQSCIALVLLWSFHSSHTVFFIAHETYMSHCTALLCMNCLRWNVVCHMEVQSSVLTPVSLVVTVRPLGNVKATWSKHVKPFKALNMNLDWTQPEEIQRKKKSTDEMCFLKSGEKAHYYSWLFINVTL